MEMPRNLSESEALFVNKFGSIAEAIANDTGIYDNFNIFTIATVANLNVIDLPREGILLQAIWVKFLTVLRNHLPKADLKYQTLETFLASYPGCFQDCSPEELKNLWETANWMNILFRYIPARKNKGLAIAIIPKLVEGWFTKYVTGSGQKKSTADRVRIFETEGDVKPNHRGKGASARKFVESSWSTPSLKNIKQTSAKRRACFKQQRKRTRTASALGIDVLPPSDVAVRPSLEAISVPVNVQINNVISLPSQENCQPLLVPPIPYTTCVHDMTDHDTDQDSQCMENPIPSDSYYFESADEFFNHYEESFGIQNPEYMNESAMVCDDDLDYAEVLRLLGDGSPRPVEQPGTTQEVTNGTGNGSMAMSRLPSRQFTTYSPMSSPHPQYYSGKSALIRSVSFPDYDCFSPRSPAQSISSLISMSNFDNGECTDEDVDVGFNRDPLKPSRSRMALASAASSALTAS